MKPKRKKKASRKAGARRGTGKKPVRRKVVARKKVVRKKVVGKKSVRKRTPRRTTPREAAGRTAGLRKPAARKRGAPAPTRTTRPRLRVVKGPRAIRPRRPAAARPSSFPQREGASAKQLVLFEMIRERAGLLAAIHGLTPAAANEPMGGGKWSVRQIVLHLVTRDQARLRESESTLHGQPASWRNLSDSEMGPMNAELMAPLQHLDWEEALRTLHRVREQLMEEVESVPEEPAAVWNREHSFGWMLHALPLHDRHHAEIIKRWRVERGA
jgi:hypothetical protein